MWTFARCLYQQPWQWICLIKDLIKYLFAGKARNNFYGFDKHNLATICACKLRIALVIVWEAVLVPARILYYIWPACHLTILLWSRDARIGYNGRFPWQSGFILSIELIKLLLFV